MATDEHDLPDRPQRARPRPGGFVLPPGRNIDPHAVRGYYLDFTEKCDRPDWPPPWFPWPGFHRFMAVPQWGLGAYERYLDGEGEGWRTATIAAADHLVEEQVQEGFHTGGWFEPNDYPHTFNVRGPWLSAMAQGQCASLLVRVYRETHDERYADAARLAFGPVRIPVSEGGVSTDLDGRSFPEEYPTDPAAFVLNGAIFTVWGYYDVWKVLDDDNASELFHEVVDTLSSSLHRWDLGYWSRYDLYPHPIVNVASPGYHDLHIRQLRALAQLAPNSEFENVADRFDAYAASQVCRVRARARKVAFRLLVPRNAFLARRMPWTRRGGSASPPSA